MTIKRSLRLENGDTVSFSTSILSGNNKQGDEEEYLFTDVDGAELTIREMYFFGPNFKNLYGVEKVSDILPWVKKNFKLLKGIHRSSLKRNIRDVLYNTFYSDICNFETYSSWSEGVGQGGRLNSPLVSFTDTHAQEGLLITNPTVSAYRATRFYKETLEWCKAPLKRPTADDKYSSLKNYTYKMSPDSFNFFRVTRKEKSSPSNGLFFGLELEISTQLSNNEIQSIVSDVEPKQKEFFIFKSDVTIRGKYGNKVEIVTVPCSPRYLKAAFRIFFTKLDKLCEKKGEPLSDFFDLSRSLSNGVHIHLSKKGFSNKFHQNRFMTTFNSSSTTTKRFLEKVSERDAYWNNHYCFIPPLFKGRKDTYMISGKWKEDGLREDRHSLCHSINRETVEVRIFQGWFNCNHVLSCIEFTEAVFWYSQYNNVRSVGGEFESKFCNWLFSTPGYRQIKKKIGVE